MVKRPVNILPCRIIYSMLNIRSLNNKFEEIKYVRLESGLDIIC